MPRFSTSQSLLLALALLARFGAAASAQPSEKPAPLGLKVPPGFEVSLYADDALATNIYSMTTDAQGRVVVSGPGYVKILHDRDRDGRAESATLFSSLPKTGAHGMLFDSGALYYTGDKGLWRIADTNGDDAADGEPSRLFELGHSEHGANGLQRGPDGWLYLICGNDAGVDDRFSQEPGSPVKRPLCGAVVRFTPNGKQVEVYAHGFRNPYDFAFLPTGQIVTVDSDNEREHHLPWYAPTRLFDVAQGMEHGWLMDGWQKSWNRPASFFDNVPRLVEIGRGSPTGVAVYRHHAFPERYRQGVFSLCWTLGRVYFMPLQPAGASFAGQLEVFLETTGDAGFAPCDVVVGRAGELFVAVGGRGTRGSVFRITHPEGARLAAELPAPRTALERVLQAPEPQSAWSRREWLPTYESLRADELPKVISHPSDSDAERIRAIELLAEFRGEAIDDVASDNATVRARIAWALGRSRDNGALAALAKLTSDADAAVARAAWEGLAAQAAAQKSIDPEPAWIAGFTHADRRVRAAALLAAARQGNRSVDEWIAWGRAQADARARLAPYWMAALTRDSNAERVANQQVEACLAAWTQSEDVSQRIEIVRLLMLALGDARSLKGEADVFGGYTAAAREQVSEELRQRIAVDLGGSFPSPDEELRRETARLLGMIDAGPLTFLSRVADQWTSESSPHDDLHYLIVAARISAQRDADLSRRTAHTLASIHGKLVARQWHPDRFWPIRVGELFEELLRRDPGLASALVDDPAFGLPAHSLFAASLSGAERERAARKLLAAVVETGDDEAWTPALVDLIASVADDAMLSELRNQWDNLIVRDSICLALARRADPRDRARLLEGVGSSQVDVIRASSAALERLDSPSEPKDYIPLLRALRGQCAVKEQRPARESLSNLLAAWSGKSISIREPDNTQKPEGSQAILAAYDPWFAWFRAAHPKLDAQVAATPGLDLESWKSRLAEVNWSQGDAPRGKLVFERKACHRCHTGAGRLGPSLIGAATRFSREDLFAAIIDPSRDVAPLYRTRLIATRSGQVHNGLIVYESSEATLVQTSPDVTVRIPAGEVSLNQPSAQSLMPTGLLNDAAPRDVADLYAYLRTITTD